jgi:hypothetical protein
MISTCPRCQKQVSIPTGVESTALVRCPLCDAEYALSEALSWAPPALIPLGLAAAAGSTPAPDDAQGELPRDSETSPDSEPLNEAAMVAKQCAAVSAPARRRRKPKSALQTLIEVVLGGVAGCLVGYYALAFYLGPEFRHRGLPELPLPGISWLTAPPADEDAALKPPPKKPARPKPDAASHGNGEQSNLAGEGKTS